MEIFHVAHGIHSASIIHEQNVWNFRLFLDVEIKQEAIDSKADVKNVILSQTAAAAAPNNNIQYSRGKF